MTDFWKELIPNLLKGKEPIQFEDVNKEYNPWMVNQSMTYHMDTILLAAEMNRFPQLSKQMQYDFYFHAVKKRNRPFNPWLKKAASDDLEMIAKYYKVSRNKAEDYINILSNEQLTMIRNEMDTGGINGNGKGKEETGKTG